MNESNNRKRSHLWTLFTVLPDNKAKCGFCYQILSYKGGSTTNLSRHMKLKHPTVQIDRNDDKRVFGDEVSEESSSGQPLSFETSNAVPSTSNAAASLSINLNASSSCGNAKSLQTKITHFTARPLPLRKSQDLDHQLVRMIVKGFYPFSVVEDRDFVKLCKMLNPNYQLPSRKTISNTFIPKLYNDTKEEVKLQLRNASAVCVTTDAWTSLKNENYIAVTIHFIDAEFVLKTFLLECFKYAERHTAENLAHEIRRVLREWSVNEKVEAVVSDNAANITAAIRILGWKHVPCFAHTLNLIVQSSLQEIADLRAKMKSVVEFFKRSPKASEKLKSIQRQMNCPDITLKQDVPTRWNSTYDMFRRILLLREPLVSACAVLNTEHKLSADDFSVVERACQILKIFEDITVEVSAEKSITVSKIILFGQALRTHCNESEQYAVNCEPIQNLTAKMREKINQKFVRFEENSPLAAATLLDPRFKVTAFQDQGAVDKIKRVLINRVTEMRIENDERLEETDSTPVPMAESATLWEDFDRRAVNFLHNPNPRASAIIEMDKYLQEPLLKRTDDPLKWWKDRENVYPNLSQIARAKLCVTATSVPSERVFSKGGLLVSKKRASLSDKNVSKVLFLNCNLK